MLMEYSTEEYFEKIKGENRSWISIIEEESLETGVFILNPGEIDTQSPHSKDEVYYIIEGNGFLNLDGKDLGVKKGKLFFVRKAIPHLFHGNTMRIKSLYFTS
ncbi:MAG: cupin domain-containing protein [Candidatus Heimdallarchaeota archaeon]|nr:cupin domain-containing protein [Candidatus Heimdallarchaeota archaeon]